MIQEIMKRDAIKKRPLSDTTLANLEPEDRDYREIDTRSLYFMVQKTGKKSWQLRYQNDIKSKVAVEKKPVLIRFSF